MKRALAVLAVLGLGVAGFAGNLFGLAGYVVPGMTLEGEPLFSFIPQIVLGWGDDPLLIAGLSFDSMYFEEGPWAYELDVETKLAINFDIWTFTDFRLFVAPIGSVVSKFLTAETGEAQFLLAPMWGIRLGAHAVLFEYSYASIFVDFQPGMGIIPGFIFGVWLDAPLGAE